jgi:ornithine cyclodeaminase/alanine dehydrogenase-like protein (mu-crystallin family)
MAELQTAHPPGLDPEGINRFVVADVTPMSPYCVFDDTEVAHFADMGELIAVIEKCFHAKAEGLLVAPPRHAVHFDSGDLVFTIGGLAARDGSPGLAGFRAYETFATLGTARSQVVAVWNTSTGDLEGLILGETLGVLRTGAIGGVAVKHMSSPTAATCGIIGSGRQAETQLIAAYVVRPSITTARVFSRNPQKRERFATYMSEKLHMAVDPVATAREAVEDADLVLCATNSPDPVIDSAWLKPGVHISTIGPKLTDQHELPSDIGEHAAVVATDSPDQIRSYRGVYFLQGTPAWERMIDLADIVAGRAKGRRTTADLTLFCSVGLAGTEVAVAGTILRRARAMHLDSAQDEPFAGLPKGG